MCKFLLQLCQHRLLVQCYLNQNYLILLCSNTFPHGFHILHLLPANYLFWTRKRNFCNGKKIIDTTDKETLQLGQVSSPWFVEVDDSMVVLIWFECVTCLLVLLLMILSTTKKEIIRDLVQPHDVKLTKFCLTCWISYDSSCLSVREIVRISKRITEAQ